MSHEQKKLKGRNSPVVYAVQSINPKIAIGALVHSCGCFSEGAKKLLSPGVFVSETNRTQQELAWAECVWGIC